MERKIGTQVFGIMILVVAGGAVLTMPRLPYWLQGGAYHGLRMNRLAPDFKAWDHTGKEIHLSDFRGKVVFLYFGFTRCSTVCPISMRSLAVAAREVDDRDIYYLYVTVDPAFDTRDRLKAYIRNLQELASNRGKDQVSKNFLGLYTDPDSLERIAKDYNITYGTSDLENEGIDHSDFIYGINRKGELSLMYTSSSRKPDQIREDIHSLLNEK